MRISTTTIQNTFGKYLSMVANNEEVIITKNGKGVAKLISYDDSQVTRVNEKAMNYQVNKKVTYEEFLELTENSDERYELIDGEVHLLASPLFKHQVALSEIFGQFFGWFKDKPCRPLTSPFDVKLFNKAEKFEDDPNVVQPDILVMCDENNVSDKGKYEGVPTLVVEVLSKSTRRKDLLKKMNLYVNSGVSEYWVVDTEHEQVSVYSFVDRELNDSISFTCDMAVESFVFKGLKINLMDIFTW